MSIDTTYPWPGIEGLWAVIVLVIALWWLVMQHRMETLSIGAVVDLVQTDGSLTALLEQDGEERVS